MNAGKLIRAGIASRLETIAGGLERSDAYAALALLEEAVAAAVLLVDDLNREGVDLSFGLAAAERLEVALDALNSP